VCVGKIRDRIIFPALPSDSAGFPLWIQHSAYCLGTRLYSVEMDARITAIADVTQGFEDDTVRERETHISITKTCKVGYNLLVVLLSEPPAALTLLVSCCLLRSAPCWLNIAQTASDMCYTSLCGINKSITYIICKQCFSLFT
jgi:hypothetical protein